VITAPSGKGRRVLVAQGDARTAQRFGTALRSAGYAVTYAASSSVALTAFRRQRVDAVVLGSTGSDGAASNLLRRLRAVHTSVPLLVAAATGTPRDAVAAMRGGAADFFDASAAGAEVVRRVHTALARIAMQATAPNDDRAPSLPRAIAALVESPEDLTTLLAWSRCAKVPVVALRRWCTTAGVMPRHVLVFGRVLRAIRLREAGYELVDVLDVADRRTLCGLLQFVGFAHEHDLPLNVDAYVARQVVVRDASLLEKLRLALYGRAGP
jgi:FixJ family two-component response regulator